MSLADAVKSLQSERHAACNGKRLLQYLICFFGSSDGNITAFLVHQQATVSRDLS